MSSMDIYDGYSWDTYQGLDVIWTSWISIGFVLVEEQIKVDVK